MIKVHLKKHSIIHYYGENYVIDFDHWTTVEDIQTGIHNLRIDIARREFFVKHIGEWTHIAIDREDLEIIPVN